MNDVATYALRLGDDALVLSQRLGEWCAHGPEIEEDIALTNIALDLLGQARTLLSYAGELEGEGRDEDALAYLRDERELTNALLVEQANGDFAQTIVRQLLFSSWQLELYAWLERSADPTLAAVAAKAVKEVAYHRGYAAEWTLYLGDGTDESRRRTEAALERLWPYAAELHETDPLVERLAAASVAPAPDELRPAWESHVRAVLGEAGLVPPETAWRPTGGRRGEHTELLGFLLAELQYVHRSYPGAAW